MSVTPSGSSMCRAASLAPSLSRVLLFCFTKHTVLEQRTRRLQHDSASWSRLYLVRARSHLVSSTKSPADGHGSAGDTLRKRQWAAAASDTPRQKNPSMLVESVSGEHGDGGQNSFFAAGTVSWSSLGLLPLVSRVLEQGGFSKPSSIQAAAIPQLLSGRDVVVAAQTGSGKTHAYLGPIAHLMLEQQAGEARGWEQQETLAAGRAREALTGGRARGRAKKFGLVLCPNATLCQQVAAMARGLRGSDGEPLLRVHALAGGEAWPLQPPDLVVATAAALLNNLFMFDPKRRRRSAFVRDVRWVVVDEADMLLSGGYARDVGRLLGLFRFEEREQSERRQAQAGQAGEEEQPWTQFRLDPDQAQLQKGGQRAGGDADGEVVRQGVGERGEEGEVGEEEEEDEKEEDLSWADAEWEEGAEARRSAAGEGGDSTRQEAHSLASTSGASEDGGARREREAGRTAGGWRRLRREYIRSKQYVFVAATLPAGGKRTVGEILRKQFPEAVWITGERLHCNTPLLEQRWVEVTAETRVEQLLEAVESSMGEGPRGGALPQARVMVFANSTGSAEAIGRVVARHGLPCLLFHRDVPLHERTAALQQMQDEGGVLVCTDAAARGVDIPQVAHVIQAEFALSAVDYLHRVGRTARAGQPGRVTSLYTAASRDLVEAVRAAAQTGEPVEGAFSRKRSFRKKLKKFGPSRRGVPNEKR